MNILLILAATAFLVSLAGLPGAGAELDPDKANEHRWYRLPGRVAIPMVVGGFFASLIFFALNSISAL